MPANAGQPPTASHAETAAVPNSTILHRFSAVLEAAYLVAEGAQKTGDISAQRIILGETLTNSAAMLGGVRHAARGVAVTLCAYKATVPAQDIRRHKADQLGGFSARSIDTTGTVPFLMRKTLNYNSETHWLSQTFSFAGPYERSLVLKTTPTKAGTLLLDVINGVEEAKNKLEAATAALEVLLVGLIEERNKGKVDLERPKNLTIDDVIILLGRHFSRHYEKNTPRLPQLAMYAIYKCIIGSMERYKGQSLAPLERMKAANRKSGTVGDIDVNRDGKPVEAVEVKFDVPITRAHVSEAIQKIRTKAVERYFILSTVGVKDGESDECRRLQADFKRSNGCEIIVNGVLDSVRYYLRLIRSSNDFVDEYTTLVESDPELGYEHRVAWNDICRSREA